MRPKYGKRDRSFKERGSVLSKIGKDDVALPGRSRGREDNSKITEAQKKQKKTKPKEVRMQVDIFIPSVVSVENLARLLKVRLETLQRAMHRAGMGAESSHNHMLTAELASLLAMEFNRNPVVNDEAAFDIFPPPPHPDPLSLPPRPPVVTIMGHVDHGKTTLLDTLRSTSVAKGEAGGITQHIGAFSVPVPVSAGEEKRTITFLDTPGHAAFSAMRARGAGVTDVVVLVVAADDGVMPQTREVIQLVKKEKVSLVVAINKIDKPGVDVAKIENALFAEGIELEKLGGEVPAVEVSGLTGQGLDQLTETISLLAEMQDLRAEREGKIQGYVLESKVQKGLGPVATVLLLRGSFKTGDHLICGTSHAKIRMLSDENGKAVKAAYPGMAVTVSGWKELPQAGDEVLTGTESEVKKAIANRVRKAEIEATLGDVEAINEQRRLEREDKDAEGDTAAPVVTGPKELRLVIKCDVSGSVEAVDGALRDIGNDVARVKIVTSGVGDITEADVMRAKAAEGAIIAFSVNVPRSIKNEAETQGVPIISSSIIYRLVDDVTERVVAMLPPIRETRVMGEANVLQVFDIHLKGRQIMKVAGCRVRSGLVKKADAARVMRNGEIVHDGRLETMKHLRDDITEARQGMECGLAFQGFEGLQAGDAIQTYQIVELPASL
ncbi:initiation factor 2 [Obba rivulosa]|uniref:Translation initiation factor IF-2, mitochondrial n=1 Tax=Obba rivulosa TaxID=1052685 RepID=A0A8E2AL72_9APHY|nr:initiation factor 2 [Obba rivulosa]